MVALILRRLLQLPLVLGVVLTLTFFMCLAIPGDPVQGAREMDPETRLRKRAEYALDEPLAVQYLIYLHRLSPLAFGDWVTYDGAVALDDGRPVVRVRWGWEWTWPHLKAPDLGESIPTRIPVWEILAASMPVSLMLGTFSMTLALAVGTAAGIVGAVWRNRWPDVLSLGLAMVGVSLPSFVTGVGLLIFGSVLLRAFPVGGWGTPAHLVLPAIALSLPFAAYIARLTRSGMLESLSQDYVRTARAKGLHPAGVVVKHAFRNAFLPVVSYLGPAMANVLTGSFVVENIFTVPGMGTHFVGAVSARDYFLILGTVLVYSTLLVLFNLVTDIAYGFLDPRIRVE